MHDSYVIHDIISSRLDLRDYILSVSSVLDCRRMPPKGRHKRKRTNEGATEGVNTLHGHARDKGIAESLDTGKNPNKPTEADDLEENRIKLPRMEEELEKEDKLLETKESSKNEVRHPAAPQLQFKTNPPPTDRPVRVYAGRQAHLTTNQ